MTKSEKIIEHINLTNELTSINQKAIDYLFGNIDATTMQKYGERRKVVIARIEELNVQLKNE